VTVGSKSTARKPGSNCACYGFIIHKQIKTFDSEALSGEPARYITIFLFVFIANFSGIAREMQNQDCRGRRESSNFYQLNELRFSLVIRSKQVVSAIQQASAWGRNAVYKQGVSNCRLIKLRKYCKYAYLIITQGEEEPGPGDYGEVMDKVIALYYLT